jgi:hypothetical protein
VTRASPRRIGPRLIVTIGRNGVGSAHREAPRRCDDLAFTHSDLRIAFAFSAKIQDSICSKSAAGNSPYGCGTRADAGSRSGPVRLAKSIACLRPLPQPCTAKEAILRSSSTMADYPRTVTTRLSNCRLSFSSAFPLLGRPRSCPAFAAAGTLGRIAGAARRSTAPGPERTGVR